MFDTAPHTPHAEPQPVPGIVFSVKGVHAGPRLVVTGAPDILRMAADRFWELRDLVEMRGALELREGCVHDFGGYADDMLHVETEGSVPHMRILGRMTALGMISGRGIPARFVH